MPGLMYNFRGVYDRDLTHPIAYLAGYHAGLHFRGPRAASPRILLANDHRFSGPVLKHYVAQGLIKAGCSVLDLGCLPTSVVSHAARRDGEGACVVTASHNPPEYNGLKFFEANGAVLKPRVEEGLAQRVMADQDLPLPPAQTSPCYQMGDGQGVLSAYLEEVAASISLPTPLRVAVDCRLGTAALIMPALLERLGCPFQAIHDRPHPYFLTLQGHYLDPEPRQDNIQDIAALMQGREFDIGLVFDGDSDRSLVVDEQGRYLPDDYVLLFLCLEAGPRESPRVVTIDTSLAVEQALQEEGIPFLVSPVGDPFVAERLEASGACFGGVPNGHYIFPQFNLYSDGIYSAAVMLRIASQLKASGLSLSHYKARFPRTHLLKAKHPFGLPQAHFSHLLVPRLAQLFHRWCSKVDCLETDDAVVMGKGEGLKLLVRYNRWDNQLNLQAESLSSMEEAERAMEEMVEEIREAAGG